MKSDEQVKREWANVDGIDHILDLIRKCDANVFDYLADTVASLCDINVGEMLSSSTAIYIAQPRWLFWYTYRYMTNDTYEKIAKRTVDNGGYGFTPSSIGHCINKMAALIEQEPIWKKRWTILRRIIKLRDSQEDDASSTITISVPKGMKDRVKIEIKEK